MAKGIFYVESRPSSPERDEEYNTWYDTVHLAEVVAVEGIVSARRLKPVNDDGAYVALYEIEADDLQSVVANMSEAGRSGRFHMSDAMQMDPPPVARLLEFMSEYP
jgi:hypothetical protein